MPSFFISYGFVISLAASPTPFAASPTALPASSTTLPAALPISPTALPAALPAFLASFAILPLGFEFGRYNQYW